VQIIHATGTYISAKIQFLMVKLKVKASVRERVGHFSGSCFYGSVLSI